MTDIQKPADAAPPAQKFNLLVAAGATLAAAAVSVGAWVTTHLPEKGLPKVTPADTSGVARGINARMDELTADGRRAAPFGIYSFENPETKRGGVLEVLSPPGKDGCQDIIVTGGGVENGTRPNGFGKDVPVGKPMRHCPAPK